MQAQKQTSVLWEFQWNLCGAEEAKEKFVQETEAKAQQIRQVAPKHIQPVLQKNKVK